MIVNKIYLSLLRSGRGPNWTSFRKILSKNLQLLTGVNNWGQFSQWPANKGTAFDHPSDVNKKHPSLLSNGRCRFYRLIMKKVWNLIQITGYATNFKETETRDVLCCQDPTGYESCFRYSRTTKNAADLVRQHRSYNMLTCCYSE